MTEDYLVKAVAENGMFRAYAVNATHLVAEAQRIHGTWSAASAALGRTLIGTLLLSTSGLQGDAGLTVKIQGERSSWFYCGRRDCKWNGQGLCPQPSC